MHDENGNKYDEPEQAKLLREIRNEMHQSNVQLKGIGKIVAVTGAIIAIAAIVYLNRMLFP